MPTEPSAIVRLAVSAVATVALALAAVVWSEAWFWGRWRPDDTLLGYLQTVVFYAAAVQVVRLVAARTRVGMDGWRRVFLVGALYGWLVEGVLVTTVVDDLPLSLSYTGLAWHALFTVLLGWWWVPRQLVAPLRRSLLALAAVGIGLGAWAAFWRFEEGVETPLLEFAVFVVLTTLAYALGIAVWQRFRDRAEPGIPGSIVALGVLLVFAVVHAIESPLTLIGPALVGVALLALVLTRPRVPATPAPPVPLVAFGRLAIVPATAVVAFGLMTLPAEGIPTGWVFYAVTVPLGVVLFAVAWTTARRR